MKKIFLLTASFIMISAAFAQIALETKTLYYNGANNESEIKLKTIIRNNATDAADDSIMWVIDQLSVQSAWAISFCDPIDCKNGVSLNDTRTFEQAKGTGAEIEIGFMFFGQAGTGSMRVIFSSTANPSNTDTLLISANSWTTAVKEVSKSANGFSFYPNPVKDVINVKYPYKNNARVEIYNVLGMKVKSFTLENSERINVSDLKKGIYYIRVIDGNSVFSKQFSKMD